jgi:hypothetical protein
MENTVATGQFITRVLPFSSVRNHSNNAPYTLIWQPQTPTCVVKILTTSPIEPPRKLHASGPFCETNYTGQQRFRPMRKNICFWCTFGRWIQVCFQNFSITHSFRSMLKGWNLLCQDTKVCFYCGCHRELKDVFSLEDGVVFCSSWPWI